MALGNHRETDPLLEEARLRRFLRAHHLPPLDRFGQHFLVDGNVLADIVAASKPDPATPVIELGAGLGVLTRALAQARERRGEGTRDVSATPLVAVELDRRLVPHLRERVREFPTVRVVQANILHVVPASLFPAPNRVPYVVPDEGGRVGGDRVPTSPASAGRVGGNPVYDVVGNIPYNITAPIFKKFFAHPPRPRRLTFLVDEAVGEAVAASPPDMSLRAVSVQVYAEPVLVRRGIPPTAFAPPPAVRSAILRLETRRTPLVAPAEEQRFFQLVRAGFSQRRKILANALAATYRLRPAAAAIRLRNARLDPKRRAETLSISEWTRLLHAWDFRGP